MPTGDETKGFGKGTTVFESFVLYGKILPNDSFLQLQGIAEFPSDSAFEDEVVVRAAYGRTWTADAPYGRAWTPMIEVLGARELASGVETEWDLVPQLQISLPGLPVCENHTGRLMIGAGSGALVARRLA